MVENCINSTPEPSAQKYIVILRELIDAEAGLKLGLVSEEEVKIALAKTEQAAIEYESYCAELGKKNKDWKFRK